MKILALTHPGTNSRELFLDIVAGARDLGHEILTLELGPLRSVFNALRRQGPAATDAGGELIHQLIDRNGIGLTMAMWSNGVRGLPLYEKTTDGTTIPLLELLGHPLLHYWWDAPHWSNEGRDLDDVVQGLFRGESQFHYITSPATGQEMAFMGFRNVICQPNGVNPDRFCPQPGIEKEYDLVFISGPGDPPPTRVMLEELKRDDPDVDRIRRDVAGSLGPQLDRLTERFADTLREPMRRLFEGLVEARLAERHAPALAHLREALRRAPDLAHAADALLTDVRAYVTAMNTIRQIETWERPFLVTYLSRHFRCLRIGHQSYDAWGIGGDVRSFVDYERQSEVYARARFALNVSRWQDDVGTNSKIFEITASGVACLAAYRSGVEDLFEDGTEIVLFGSPAEARQRLAEALSAGPDRWEALADAGRKRTLRDHTWARRMEVVLDMVECYRRKRGQTVAPRPPIKLPDSSLAGAGIPVGSRRE